MKHLTFLLAVSTMLIVTAVNTSTAQGNSRIYIMKKDGKLTEVMNGARTAVTGDVTLPNHATVHPDGSVDDIDGNKKQVNEGEYISFVDGRIRKLSASPATASATTATSTATTRKTAKSVKPKKSAGNS